MVKSMKNDLISMGSGEIHIEFRTSPVSTGRTDIVYKMNPVRLDNDLIGFGGNHVEFYTSPHFLSKFE
jgi:hypothetical protein